MRQSEIISLDKDEIAHLQEIFTSSDRNHDGIITKLELGSLLRSVGLKPSLEHLEALILKADTNNNDLIEFSKFILLMVTEKEAEAETEIEKSTPYTAEKLCSIFCLFDRDESDFIMAAELAHSMARLGNTLTVKELARTIREANMDGDGQISFSEFAKAISCATLADQAIQCHNKKHEV